MKILCPGLSQMVPTGTDSSGNETDHRLSYVVIQTLPPIAIGTYDCYVSSKLINLLNAFILSIFISLETG